MLLRYLMRNEGMENLILSGHIENRNKKLRRAVISYTSQVNLVHKRIVRRVFTSLTELKKFHILLRYLMKECLENITLIRCTERRRRIEITASNLPNESI